MCGFVGFTNTIENAEEITEAMMDAIRHRGPDAGGKYVDEDQFYEFVSTLIEEMDEKE